MLKNDIIVCPVSEGCDKDNVTMAIRQNEGWFMLVNEVTFNTFFRVKRIRGQTPQG